MNSLSTWIKVFVLFAVLSVVAACTVEQERRTVSSSGNAKLSVQPDEAQVVVAVEILAPTAEASKNRNAQVVDKVYGELYKIAVPRDAIETEYFNIYEEFDWTESGGRRSLGFKTVHTLKITLQNFQTIGAVIDAATAAGATSIQSITFEISDARRKELKKQALQEASRDAREKAEAIADGLDAELGKIVSVSDVAYDYLPYRVLEAAAPAAVAKEQIATQISPGNMDVAANVQVVFEIE